MLISVILIAHGKPWTLLEKCLQSLTFLIQRNDTEIIYVDNHTTDLTISHIEQYFPTVKIIRLTRNMGVAAAINQGIKHATGQYIWLLDADTVVNLNAFLTMLNYMNTNANTALCACKLVGTDGLTQNSARKFPTLKGKTLAALYIVAKKLHLRVQYETTRYTLVSDYPTNVDYLIGACQFIGYNAINQVGMLDEHIFYGPEDADFCLRLKIAGFDVAYLPGASILHHYQQVSNKKILSKLTLYHLIGLAYFFWKYRKFDLNNSIPTSR